jgi:type IV secretory pathway TraG/TraD family ATPase VirD4
LIAWGTNDLDTEEYLSRRIGKVTVTETSYGDSGGVSGVSGSMGHSSNSALRERMIRFSNEIREQGARETMRAFVIPASGKAFTVERQPYMNLAKHKVYDSPAHVKRWEAG